MATWKPKYQLEIGDLVRITDEAIKYEIVKTRPNIGIIMSKPYCYISTEHESTPENEGGMVELEHWCYDIFFSDRISRMMPEDFIEPIKKEDK